MFTPSPSRTGGHQACLTYFNLTQLLFLVDRAIMHTTMWQDRQTDKQMDGGWTCRPSAASSERGFSSNLSWTSSSDTDCIL